MCVSTAIRQFRWRRCPITLSTRCVVRWPYRSVSVVNSSRRSLNTIIRSDSKPTRLSYSYVS
uniref:Uncharacterized protein n=1 Tax=Parascaris equorum TaxID=6256 RepID=A0A914RPV1_PAREQ